jgi:hypothetical protein
MEGVMPETKVKVGNVYRYAPKGCRDFIPGVPMPEPGAMIRIIEAPQGWVTLMEHTWIEGAVTGEFMGQVPVSDLIEVA